VPSELRRELAQDYAEVAELLSRIEQGRLHLAVFGRVSVGKSSLLNALAGEARFATGVLHGTTTERAQTTWQEAESHGVVLIDTPGINELSGEDREALALQVASRSDLLLFVVDGDMTALERDALQAVAAQHRPLLLVLNKADRYGPDERSLLLQRLREHAADWVAAENVLAVAAQPADERVLMVHADGHEELVQRPRDSDIVELKQRILAILEKEGKALTALNATLFAGQLSDTLGQRLTAARATSKVAYQANAPCAPAVSAVDSPALSPFKALATRCTPQIAPIKAISCAVMVASNCPASRRVKGKP
jgi:small GTP-binding protein